MVRAALVLLALSAQPAASAEKAIGLAAWAAALPPSFTAHGTKTEPTYEATVEIARVGDVVSATGGAPAWAARATEVARVSAAGTLCLGVVPCVDAPSAPGFLATAALIGALRRHGLSGSVTPVAFGSRQVVCVAGEQLGIVQPILDPCFDRLSGAAIAQRHRLSGAFDGPTLDPTSIRIDIPAAIPAAPARQAP